MIAILGAGIAGLSAAYELIKSKVPGKGIIIFEREGEVGGLAQTKTHDGFKFDLGPHRWFTKSRDLERTWLEINSPDILELNRLTRIWYKKKLFNYPISAFNALKNMGIAESTLAVLTYSAQALKNKYNTTPPQNMEEAFIRQFGKTLYNAFFKEYNQKLWGGNGCEDLSPDWVKQRVKNLSLAQALLDAVGLGRKGKIISLVDRFKYPSNGTGQLTGNMARIINDSDSQILCNCRVEKVITESGKISRLIVSREERKEEYEVNYCISSIPIDMLTRAITPSLSPITLEMSSGLRYRHLIFVILFINKPRVMQDNWIYVQDPSVSFNRFMDMGSWNPSLSKPGMTSLIFEVSCEKDDNNWVLSEKEWVAKVSEEFVTQFRFVEKSQILGGKVFRKTHAYPVYALDYKKRLKVIKDELGGIKNLQLIGRNGLFRYNNMDHSMASGIAAAKNYLGSSIDIDAINVDVDYHEEVKVKS